MATENTHSGIWIDAGARRKPADRELISRRLVYSMFLMTLAILLVVSISVFSGQAPTAQPEASPIIRSNTVTIAGTGNHARVTDDRGQVLLDGNGGFIAVVRDGLERARLVAGVSGNPAVTITQHESGRFSLYDPASDWRMELSSFGQGNVETFLAILNQDLER